MTQETTDNGHLNGRQHPRQDLNVAAELLYDELSALPWFVAVEPDEAGKRLILEAKDMPAALAWIDKRDWFGWRLEVRKSRCLFRRTEILAAKMSPKE